MGAGYPVLPVRAAVLRTLGRPLKIWHLEMEDPRDDEVLVRLGHEGLANYPQDC